MNLNDKNIIKDFKANYEDYETVKEILKKKLKDIAAECKVEMYEVEARVKTEESLVGKIYRKQGKYKSISEITDLVGARFIAYFEDDLHLVDQRIQKEFKIDWANSIDKIKSLNTDAFGYLSIHYTGFLKPSKEYDKRLCQYEFEIQLRTACQHVWAMTTHDILYKSKFGVPRPIQRASSRIAALLEICDREFAEMRKGLNIYVKTTHDAIVNNKVDGINIDLVSLKEYVYYNKEMQALIKQISEIEHSEVEMVDPENYITQLADIGITTLQQLSDALKKYGKLAYELAYLVLHDTGIDLINSNVALRYIVRAVLCENEASEKQITWFLNQGLNDEKRAAAQAKLLLEQYAQIKASGKKV